ncbi:MAG TPA: arabinan endo-1,5-alpha-L-arabinosidase [Candidatus Acidoferrales bacterium]|nr:arabinan endo-1,5-alpha-L-arabinosidase [Candidatus Acidoferrales bacterium]
MTRRACFASMMLLLCATRAPAQSEKSPVAVQLEGDVQGTHDPSIIKQGNTWYVFSTTTGRGSTGQLPVRCSGDLKQWKRCGDVLPAIPDWIKQDSPGTRGLWAPDISYFDGLFHLYYVYSLFGKNTSGIALLTNKTLDPASPDFHWTDQGLVLRSTAADDFNAIDPNLAIDAKGGTWLVFGSFWSGIKLRRIDRATGKLSSADTTQYSLAIHFTERAPNQQAAAQPSAATDIAAASPSASGAAQRPANTAGPHAIEAPFIVRKGRFYYLFVSVDFCCRGAQSTYKVMVGRARRITGPYADESGKRMIDGGGTLLLSGNSKWAGPGGESVLLQKSGDIIVYHAYDAHTGQPSLQISTITWAKNWPRAAIENP